MKKLLILALLALPAAAYSQELTNTELEDAPAAKGAKAEGPESLEPVPRPDAKKIMSELSTALRLSSKQEDRISAAVSKKTAQFDKLLKEYDKNSEEEKKWRYKMNASRHEMVKLNRGLPDVIREFLDDDQRQSYDELLEARKTGGAGAGQAAGEEGAAKPVKKKRLVRRKKLPPPSAGPGEEEAGQVMVDKEAAPAPGPKKKKMLRKKPGPKAEAAEAEEPAGARPTGKEAAPEEEDAGSYP